MSAITEFNDYRERMNERIFQDSNRVIKRFFNLDSQTYEAGALPVQTKEMLGLAASMVLRCDDCIRYHVGKCHEEGVSQEELMEVMSISLIVGGSIVIPHLRRAVEYWDLLQEAK